jgi:hypothetical protein
LVQIPKLWHLVVPATGWTFHLSAGLPRDHVDLAGTARAGQQKDFLHAVHDLVSAAGSTPPLHAELLPPISFTISGRRLESSAIFLEKFTGFSHPTGA